MKQRKPISKQKVLDGLMYEFTATCCGDSFTWPGRVPEGTRYTCRKCGGEMAMSEEQVLAQDAAELIVRNSGRFNGEECPCGCKLGHYPVYKEDDDAWFLQCGKCGDEMRELEWEEVE